METAGADAMTESTDNTPRADPCQDVAERIDRRVKAYISELLDQPRPPHDKRPEPWTDERIVSEVDDALWEANAETRERARRLLRSLRDDHVKSVRILEGERERLRYHLGRTMHREAWAERERKRQWLYIQQLAHEIKLGRGGIAQITDDFSEGTLHIIERMIVMEDEIASLKAQLKELEPTL